MKWGFRVCGQEGFLEEESGLYPRSNGLQPLKLSSGDDVIRLAF